MPQLLHILANAKHIDTIIFKNVPTSDDHFIKFLGQASPYILKKISFTGCGLSSVSYPSIKTFLNQKPPKGYSTKQLDIFDMTGNSLTAEEFQEIEEIVRIQGETLPKQDPNHQNEQNDSQYSSESDGYNDSDDVTINNMTIQTIDVKPSEMQKRALEEKQKPMQRSFPPRKLLYSSSPTTNTKYHEFKGFF